MFLYILLLFLCGPRLDSYFPKKLEDYEIQYFGGSFSKDLLGGVWRFRGGWGIGGFRAGGKRERAVCWGGWMGGWKGGPFWRILLVGREGSR
jgi:hypothetical protein